MSEQTMRSLTWEQAEELLEEAAPHAWTWLISRSTCRLSDLVTRKFTITIEERGVGAKVFDVAPDKLDVAVNAILDHWANWRQRRADGVLQLD